MSEITNKTSLTSEERDDADRHQHLPAHVVYEAIRGEGEHELARPTGSLIWSGIAAGLGMGFSLMTEGLLFTGLPDTPWRELVSDFGYCIGFVIVILARQQLFTENTITAVLPLLASKSWKYLVALIRLWSIVFAANMIGTAIFAGMLASNQFFTPDALESFRTISRHLTESEPGGLFLQAIIAGWLIATLVWLLPSSEGAELWVIILITYIISLAGLAHVIAGSVEIWLLLFIGDVSLGGALLNFLLPALAGNVIGGTALFALISYAQVREKI